MQHITGIPRNQMCFSSLEDTISPDNPVRFIDAFVEAIALESLGFATQTIKIESRQDKRNPTRMVKPRFRIRVRDETKLFNQSVPSHRDTDSF